jgi:CDP-diglyceride synthetase
LEIFRWIFGSFMGRVMGSQASNRGPTVGEMGFVVDFRFGILVGFLVGFLVVNLPSRWNRLGGDQGSAKTSSGEHSDSFLSKLPKSSPEWLKYRVDLGQMQFRPDTWDLMYMV